jgi:hypothetical protein
VVLFLVRDALSFPLFSDSFLKREADRQVKVRVLKVVSLLLPLPS